MAEQSGAQPVDPDADADFTLWRLWGMQIPGEDTGEGPYGSQVAPNPYEPSGPPVRRHVQTALGMRDLWPTKESLGTGNIGPGSLQERLRALGPEMANVEYVQQLGAGTNAAVHLFRRFPIKVGDTEHQQTIEIEVAAKLILLQPLAHPDAEYEDILGKLMSDMHALALLRHPNIVEYFDFIGFPDLDTGFPYGGALLVTERCLGDLFSLGEDVVTQYFPAWNIPGDLTLHIFRQIVSAVSYLHGLNVVHLDIKVENILYTFVPPAHPAGQGVDINDIWNMTFKLTDFGTSMSFEAGVEALTSSRPIGTLEYMSPEMAAAQPNVPILGKPCDVYSVAQTAMALHLGTQFDRSNNWQHMNAICLNILQSPQPTPDVDNRIVEIVYYMTQTNPNQRPTIEAVAQHLQTLH